VSDVAAILALEERRRIGMLAAEATKEGIRVTFEGEQLRMQPAAAGVVGITAEQQVQPQLAGDRHAQGIRTGHLSGIGNRVDPVVPGALAGIVGVGARFGDRREGHERTVWRSRALHEVLRSACGARQEHPAASRCTPTCGRAH